MNELFQLALNAGGTVAVSAIFLWYVDRQDKRNNTLICNHLEHSTQALNKMAISLTKLTSILKQLKSKSK